MQSTHADPVCGMPVTDTGAEAEWEGTRYWFCSEFCRQQFLRRPFAYTDVPPGAAARPQDWSTRRVAYFSMEIALANSIPTYAGGLGVLAGDTVRSCADLGVPVVAVSLVHRRGYFRQELRDGGQVEHEARWVPEDLLSEVGPHVHVELEGRRLRIRGWRFDVTGASGHVVPVVLLDTDVPDNVVDDRRLTDRLYGGNDRDRLMQEVVLGVGGMRLLQAVGCTGLRTLHLNEGHAALAPLELLRAWRRSGDWDFGAVRRRTVFTTHTPVPAGHDRFDRTLVARVLGEFVESPVLEMLGGQEALTMTGLALNLSHYVNGVALRHREVSSQMFPQYEIHQITNGVHHRTWTAEPIKKLFDLRIPGWRDDPSMLRNAIALASGEVWEAHDEAKRALLARVLEGTGRRLRHGTLTIGFARRATAYKRSGLVLSDLARLRGMARALPIQLVFAGKAHPRDEAGKQAIRAILEAGHALGDDVPVVFLPEYDLDLALALVAGVDVWLNTPQRPQEASGTSGMKAALNGVPSLSVLDGWWREGCVEGTTGWAIGPRDSETRQSEAGDASDLYHKLETVVAPLFYGDREAWVDVMRHAMALNGSFFNTHRMVRQYAEHAYDLGQQA
ncbi:MAG: alpha-glucan family phosphorylase [Vicinamibacterales bacterium]